MAILWPIYGGWFTPRRRALESLEHMNHIFDSYNKEMEAAGLQHVATMSSKRQSCDSLENEENVGNTVL